MNARKTLIAAVTMAFAGIAAAQEATPDTWLHEAQMSKSRAEVQAELAQARKDGTIGASGSSYNFVARAKIVKTRDEVKAELAQAKASGEFDMLNRDQSLVLAQSLPGDTAIAGARSESAVR